MQKKQKIILTIAIIFTLLVLVSVIVLVSNKIITSQGDQSASKTVQEKKDKKKINRIKIVEEEVEEENAEVIILKTTSTVNLREEPSTESDIIKTLDEGTEVEKISEESDWVKVKHEEDIGYVSAEFVEEVKEDEEVPKEEVKTETTPGQHRDSNSKIVVIDPGHQLRGDSTPEPNGPGASTTKARVTGGTTGVATRVSEYILNLDISLKLKTELENRGYTVYMTRSVHEVNISNMERAKYASSVNADIAVRIHANGSANSSVKGAEAYVPSASNPYVSHLAADSYNLGKCIVDHYSTATGFINRGVFRNDTMTGMNWSEVPVAILEMGYMSNAEDDRAMQDPAMQSKMVQGIANGIDAYFGF